MEKKYRNKIVFLINILCLPVGLQAVLGFQGFASNQDYQSQTQQNGSESSNTQNCINQSCTTSDNQQGSLMCCANGCAQPENNGSALYIPPFTVQILDKSQKILNSSGKLLTINNSSAAVLVVQIFPASNDISSSVSFIGEKNHLIMYTIKDFLGSIVLVDYDVIPSSQGIPSFINIPSVLAVSSQNSVSSQVAPQAGINSTSGTSAANISLFGSNNASLADTTAMTILNGLSALTQKFIINSPDNQNFNITPISGSTDSEVSQVSTISGVSSVKNLLISFNDQEQTTLFTFAGNNLSFDADLQQGVTLNIIIYPANSNGSYQVIASLRSSDGSKYRKQYALVSNNVFKSAINPLTSLPSTITISDSGTTNTSTRNFFNTNTASNNPSLFNFAAPISLQFRITS